MPAGGQWNTTNPPIRAGAYFNFTAALQAALNSGVIGTAAIIGTADWGIVGATREITGGGDYDANYGNSTQAPAGTLRDGVIGALDGFDGSGAGMVLAFRAAGSAKAKATLPLASAGATVLTLTAKYEGVRANNFHVTVQTNGSNKDLILDESGVELERYENVTGGTGNAFLAAINTTSPSRYIVASVTAGDGSHALTNIVGVAGGAGGFGTGGGGVAGNSGTTLTSGDVTTALGVLATTEFDTIALSNITDDTTVDAFIAWLRDRNEAGKRCFAVIGGVAAEPVATAVTRSTEYDGAATYRLAAQNVVNLGASDLRRLSDDVVLSTAQLATRMAGHLAAIGFTRDLTGIKFTGYQVNPTLTSANYLTAQNGGVVMFDNDTTQRVMVESGVNAQITDNQTTRPAALAEVRNVAITHFIENTLSRVAKDLYIGTLANSNTGRADLVGSFLRFLKDLEEQGALQVGQSTVVLDDAYVQTGDAVFLRYGIKFQGVIKRIFGNVQIGT